MNPVPNPKRGEIWFTHLPTDPPGKNPRPVLIVSTDSRNLNERADTVLVIPLTTSIQTSPYRVALQPRETGLQETSMLNAQNISTLRKVDLIPPRHPLRRLSGQRLRECAVGVVRVMGFSVELQHIR